MMVQNKLYRERLFFLSILPFLHPPIHNYNNYKGANDGANDGAK
jgi:hypothetical protein